MKTWAVVLGGITYEGRPLSGEAVRRFQERVAAAGENQRAQEAALTALLRLSFPLSWASLWRGDPVRRLLVSPNRKELLADFFAFQRSALLQSVSPTTGTGSKLRTVTP